MKMKKEKEFFDKLSNFNFKKFEHKCPLKEIWMFDKHINTTICGIDLNIGRIELRWVLDVKTWVFTLSNGDYIDLQTDRNGKQKVFSNYEPVLEIL